MHIMRREERKVKSLNRHFIKTSLTHHNSILYVYTHEARKWQLHQSISEEESVNNEDKILQEEKER